MKNGQWMKEWKQCLNDISKHIILLLPHGTTNIVNNRLQSSNNHTIQLHVTLQTILMNFFQNQNHLNTLSKLVNIILKNKILNILCTNLSRQIESTNIFYQNGTMVITVTTLKYWKAD